MNELTAMVCLVVMVNEHSSASRMKSVCGMSEIVFDRAIEASQNHALNAL